MKKGKLDLFVSLGRQRSIQILMFVGFLYMFLVFLEVPFVFKTGFSAVSQEGLNGFFADAVSRSLPMQSKEETAGKDAPIRPLEEIPLRAPKTSEFKALSSLTFHSSASNNAGQDGFLGIQKSAREAFELGKKLWVDLESGKALEEAAAARENRTESCPNSMSFSGAEFTQRGQIMVLPCGLTLGSHITLVGKPREAHQEQETKISMLKDGQSVMVSQFIMELQGLKTVDGEEPPRILHFNPRLKGDWSGKPVIEQNTCYRMQWGTAQRCEGWKSRADEETGVPFVTQKLVSPSPRLVTQMDIAFGGSFNLFYSYSEDFSAVDGQVKCEKWIRDDDDSSEESKSTWWLSRLIGRTRKVTVDWPYPFAEGKLFVLTLSAGLEGYHVNVDGRHVTSFPYRTGFSLEDATGLFLNGDVDLHSIFAASLPTSHPSFAPQRHLEMSSRWKAPPLPEGPLEMFIGILSAGNHFAERMAVRKSWMQHRLVKSSNAVARFFVALHSRKEVDVELKKEAEFFGDIIIVPYMDNYDLVVLKTVAICEYGARVVSAKYIMKCDDDTFVRVDAVINEVGKVPDGKSFYVGNINYYHKPLRTGKWAVTYEEWPEEDYPPYANGPGYIVSSDIANFILSEYEKHRLRLFKMEDVSMGMWVEQFVNRSQPVEYVHSFKFCQFGCIEDYYTAHYQSPRQMICMWNKLQLQAKPQCCNMR